MARYAVENVRLRAWLLVKTNPTGERRTLDFIIKIVRRFVSGLIVDGLVSGLAVGRRFVGGLVVGRREGFGGSCRQRYRRGIREGIPLP